MKSNKYQKTMELAAQMKKNRMDSKASLLESLAIVQGEEVTERVQNIIKACSISLASLIDLPKDAEIAFYDALLNRVAEDTVYVSEDGETKKTTDLGITDENSSPESVMQNGKTYKKMKSVTTL